MGISPRSPALDHSKRAFPDRPCHVTAEASLRTPWRRCSSATATTTAPLSRGWRITSPEHFARIWRLPDLTVAHTLRHNAELWNLDFSLDGSRQVTQAKNNVAHVWITDVFNRDERYLATTSDHGTARIWDLASGQEVSRLSHENSNVADVGFSSDGRYVATAGWDHAARVWLGKPEDLIREATSRLSRNLSAEEWEKYLPGEPCRETMPARLRAGQPSAGEPSGGTDVV